MTKSKSSKRDQIIEAAEALQAEGVNPSMAAVRERVGGGSFATISPILREWRESQEQRATVAIEMPSAAKAALDRAGVDIWRTVTDLATEKLARVQASAENAVQAATTERDEALNEIEKLEFENAQLKQEMDAATKSKELAEDKAVKLDMQVHKLQISLDAATKSIDELKTEIRELRQKNEEKARELGKMSAINEQNQRLENRIRELQK